MTEHIAQAHWETFLNDFAKKHHGFDARIEIIGRDVGDQDMATWLPFSGISYNPHHHQIFVTVGGSSSHYPVHLTHMIDAPHTLAVRYSPAGEVRSLLLTSGDKLETLVTLRRQQALGNWHGCCLHKGRRSKPRFSGASHSHPRARPKESMDGRSNGAPGRGAGMLHRPVAMHHSPALSRT